MTCPHCQSTAVRRRKQRTALGYRTFRCNGCRRRFNERSGSPYNDLQFPTDVVLPRRPDHEGGDGVGEPRCASGHREERGWARPERPGSAAGRYACRIEDGFASMWWTADSSGVLVHAVRTDANLAALFDWWRSEAPRALG